MHDLAYLKNFCEGDEERMRKYISMFLESIPYFRERIEKAVSENDLPEISRQVHTMKPKFMMMGMKDAQELAVKIEQQYSENETDLLSIKENISKLLSLAYDAGHELHRNNTQ